MLQLTRPRNVAHHNAPQNTKIGKLKQNPGFDNNKIQQLHTSINDVSAEFWRRTLTSGETMASEASRRRPST
jgi:hypothetical protein